MSEAWWTCADQNFYRKNASKVLQPSVEAPPLLAAVRHSVAPLVAPLGALSGAPLEAPLVAALVSVPVTRPRRSPVVRMIAASLSTTSISRPTRTPICTSSTACRMDLLAATPLLARLRVLM